MTKEEKSLLLQDLCARLPYHLLGKDAFGKTREMKVIYPTGTIIAQEIDGENCSSCGFIPYLRPISSVTEDEEEEYNSLLYGICDFTQDTSRLTPITELTTFFHSHHFDYRGLIEKGLALEAPEGMYNTKTE